MSAVHAAHAVCAEPAEWAVDADPAVLAAADVLHDGQLLQRDCHADHQAVVH